MSDLVRGLVAREALERRVAGRDAVAIRYRLVRDAKQRLADKRERKSRHSA